MATLSEFFFKFDKAGKREHAKQLSKGRNRLDIKKKVFGNGIFYLKAGLNV